MKKENKSCPKCNSNAFQKIIHDFGYGLSLKCSECGHNYEVVEPGHEIEEIRKHMNEIIIYLQDEYKDYVQTFLCDDEQSEPYTENDRQNHIWYNVRTLAELMGIDMSIYDDVKEIKPKEIIPKMWEVNIQYIHGQSFTPREIFEGKYHAGTIKEIIGSVSENVSPYWGDGVTDSFFIDCNNEKMKQQLIAEIIRKQPKLEVTTEKNKPGSNWGYNISVNLVEVK